MIPSMSKDSRSAAARHCTVVQGIVELAFNSRLVSSLQNVLTSCSWQQQCLAGFHCRLRHNHCGAAVGSLDELFAAACAQVEQLEAERDHLAALEAEMRHSVEATVLQHQVLLSPGI